MNPAIVIGAQPAGNVVIGAGFAGFAAAGVAVAAGRVEAARIRVRVCALREGAF